ncbi:hypothetical protein GGR21_000273 [Dysgonomonas hofstadii]|uniref:Linalool dehydratase/isomerase domain-containing protein n=1 Tax=Dysgonomonas hofstadii TaxID=637886 RepID=A0A840CK36_9BACT|nr:hypothetical protein [Dysgonomonas hofstadii]MBB4034388.1 hypothetical protein [Dysgonomonas hofstadii]
MKLRNKIFLGLLFLFVIWLVAIQFQTYTYPDAEEIDKRLNYLERVVYQPLDPDGEIYQIGYESHEFMLFSYAYSAYALTNIAVKDSTYKERAIPLIRECIAKSLTRKIYSAYGVDESLAQQDSVASFSVLYLGHLNLMMGCYRLLSGDNAFNDLNDKITRYLAGRYENTPFMNLESYPDAIWIPDNTVALASLKLHDANTGSGYGDICKRWIEYAKVHYIESKTGVLYSTVAAKSGEALEEPRGSMLGWSIMFIYQFDNEFAIELYNNYKKYFSFNLLAFRLFKERSNSFEISLGDIDSGPLFFGYSIPANEFALGGAVISGDVKTARQIERLIEFGASEKEENNELKYKIRFIDMNINPMAEALVLNSLTLTRWVEE